MSSEPSENKPKRQRAEERVREFQRLLSEAQNKLTETQRQSETYLSQLQYCKADLENIQKQTQRRIEESVQRGTARILAELLPITDELSIASEKTKDGGITMIQSKLLKLLDHEGVTPIEAVGKPFDPYKHEAVLEIETAECPPGTVIEEIRKGYTYRDKTLRPTMAKVARAPVEKKEEKTQ
jgi:molecular chaperone GrpE